MGTASKMSSMTGLSEIGFRFKDEPKPSGDILWVTESTGGKTDNRGCFKWSKMPDTLRLWQSSFSELLPLTFYFTVPSWLLYGELLFLFFLHFFHHSCPFPFCRTHDKLHSASFITVCPAVSLRMHFKSDYKSCHNARGTFGQHLKLQYKLTSVFYVGSKVRF